MNDRISKPVKRKFLDSDDSSDDGTSLELRDRSSSADVSSDSFLYEEDNTVFPASYTESDSSVVFVTSSSSSSSSSVSTESSKSKSSAKSKKNPVKNVPSDSSSESGDENCEKCAICLRSITSQEVGNPEVCDHIFCSVCIIEWSKNSNVCPLDRQQFSIILVRDNKTGTVVRKVTIGEGGGRQQDGQHFWQMIQAEYVDDTVCEICGLGDREDIMLLCDLCDRGFHTVCLTPPLDNIPDENEWYCPDCTTLSPNEEANPELPSHSSRTLRPRFSMVRTRLLERIRMTVNRIVENYVLRQSDSVAPSASNSQDSDSESSSSSILNVVDIDQPSTSGLQRLRQSTRTTGKKASPKSRKRTRKTTKTNGRRKRKRKSTTTTTTTTRKRKTTTGGKRKTTRRTKVKTTRTKKVKVENDDGSVTEKVVKTRTYKRRRQKTRKKKAKTTSIGIRRGLRVKSKTTPKTVKGRLTLKLKMMPPNKPGQLLPDIKVKPANSHLSLIDLNRARAGIPKLHIFGPRDELQYYSSESDHEGFGESGSGGVLTATQTRTNLSRMQNRNKAVLLLQSRASTPRATSQPKPVIESSPESVDILGSILDSQAIWHSKKTNVKINDDGSIEVIKDDNKEVNNVPKPKNSNKSADVREKSPEGVITQAPMYPGSGSRPGGFRPYNRNNYGDSRNRQDNMFGPRGGPGQAGTNFNRFGGPARNDREGYANYLNNMPQGPTPFCRGGPPLRFRMPPRQQLRRIPFPPRNRPAWTPEEESDDANSIDKEEKKTEEEEEHEEEREGEKKDKGEPNKRQEEDEDVDLYSDIETSMDKTDNSGAEDTAPSYPALGPPPEPSPFLLGLNDGEDLEVDNKDKSEVYDPAEPCDSDDEIIDENREPAPIEEKKEPEVTNKESGLVSASPKAETDTDADHVTKSDPQKCSSEDDDDEDCPIFSIYSSATRAFSEKEEEERQREIAEDRRRLEEAKKQEEQKSKTDSEPPADEKEPEETLEPEVTKEEEEEEPIKEDAEVRVERQDKPKEKPQVHRLSFHIDDDIDTKSDDKSPAQDDSSGSPELAKEKSRSRSASPTAVKVKEKQRSPSVESDRETTSVRLREKSSSTDGSSEKFKRSARKRYDSDSGGDAGKSDHDRKSDDDKENDEAGERVVRARKDDRTPQKDLGSEYETVLSPQRVAVGLEGLDVEEVSSDNEGDEFADKRSLSSFSLSELSNKSRRSVDSDESKKKKKIRKKKMGKPKEDKNREDDERGDGWKESKNENDEIRNENSLKAKEKRKGRKSESEGLERQVLGSKENKKSTDKGKDKDLSWKKPSKKDRNYREGKKKSKERARSKSLERRKSRSPTPKKDKRKNKERKKKADKKKDMERYDVRKVVKNKEVRKTDAFGRDIISKSRSISRSRSRSPIRERSRNMLRRDSRSFSRSRSRSFRRGRTPVRRRYVRSRSRSRSKSATRRSYSRSRSRSRSRKIKKKPKSKDRLKIRSRSRGRKSRSCSRGGGRRRSPTRSRSRSPAQRIVRTKKTRSRRRSWSHHESRTPSFSPRRSRSMTRSPIRVGRTYSRSVSRSWSRGRSPLPRASSLEKLTVILTTKDKKKWKKKKDGKKTRKEEKKKKKATGNSKEVFASGDNVLVSVNFRNNNSSNANDSSSVTNNDRNTRLNSLSPGPALETSSRKRKRGSDYENEKVTKKSKKSGAISKKVVDVALSNSCPKRTKKLTRLSEKDAEVILNRKPVAVIDLDMSPYREQTPSPVNVVVVSDSGSGDEGKERSPQRANVRGTPNVEAEKVEENVGGPSVDASTTNSPVENGYVPTQGPKTPPEPQIKFSINKTQQLRPIANPLGDDEDDEEEEAEEEEDREDEGDEAEVEERLESLDIRIEKELNQRSEISHKGPNTPPTPRGPSTPKSPPSPQSSPDAYDPFEPTKSRSPTPSQDDKENQPTSKTDAKEDETSESVEGEGLPAVVTNSTTEDSNKATNVVSENQEGKTESSEKSEPGPAIECSSSNVATPSSGASAPASDSSSKESPERKIGVVVSTPHSKSQTPTVQKTFSPVLKQVPMVSSSATVQPTSVSMAVSTDMFGLSSPTKTRTSTSTTTATTQTLQVSGIQRLQHRLGSPVNRTPNSVKSTPEKRTTPRPESNNEILSSGNYMIRNVSKRNGEQPKQTRPLQDATNETIDVALEMDDSPYSPASSEGDDLFDPPPDVSKPSQSNSKTTPTHKALPKAHHKSPTKQLSKFDLLFGVSGPTLSPLKVGTKKTNTKLPGKPLALPKLISPKPQKKGTSKRNMNKMDEDQLRILDELPSSAVELQVKDKFLKKLNRQERVVDEVKTVLKPHYARKHITKEEYKDILRRSVPKICHSRSGEINPSKIQSLIEAYVRKFRHAKKKGLNTVPKPKVKKTMFS